MSERKSGGDSTILPPSPAEPIVSWDFSLRTPQGQILRSEPNIMIWPMSGPGIVATKADGWERRGVVPGGPVKRFTQFAVKPPKVCG